MKITYAFLLLLAVACAPEDATPNAPIMDEFDPTGAKLLKTGDLVGVNHNASGKAHLYEKDGQLVVVLDPYESENGPDLKVYLSRDGEASSYVNLGKLKSTMGKQSYLVPANTNPADYNFVLVWCEKFSVLFGRSAIM